MVQYTPTGELCGVIENITAPGIVIVRLHDDAGQWHGHAGNLVLSSDAIHVLSGHL